MQIPENVPQSPNVGARSDRLNAFFGAFQLRVDVLHDKPTGHAGSAAMHLMPGPSGDVESLLLVVRGKRQVPRALVTARVQFGGDDNPLIHTLPERVTVPLGPHTAMRAVVHAFLQELATQRCGQRHAVSRLGEVLFLMALRAALEQGSARPCMLAGLAHPQLHAALAAIHESPADPWTVDELASVAGMSRSRFMASFSEVVGTTPIAYLTRWRLQLGRRELRAGGAKVKAVARKVGFSSGAAFSRAYMREFGIFPTGDVGVG
jgi:AraC-like DNA-binding protein